MAMKIAVIICAAGASNRFSQKKKKQFTDISGRAAFLRSVELFADNSDVSQIIVAVPAKDMELVSIRWGANLDFFSTQLCTGGAERFETVSVAMDLVRADIDLIAVHDGARCCLTSDWISSVFAKAAETGAALLACPVTNTLKRVAGGFVTETIDRSGIYQAQTPQVFRASLLRKAYANLVNLDRSKITDDCQLVESLGHAISIVETDDSNIKLTNFGDIKIAEAILKSRDIAKPRTSFGPYGEPHW